MQSRIVRQVPIALSVVCLFSALAVNGVADGRVGANAATGGQATPAAADHPTAARETSFEEVVAGRFEILETTIGQWTPVTGTTIVDDAHAYTGRHCLWLTGGEQTTVTLTLADRVDSTGVLTFQAERWTSRTPFSFRIDVPSGDGWTQIFHGDSEVRVGRAFLSRIRIPLSDDSIRQFRFTCTSPADTGILIDDVRIAPALPQSITRVEVVPLTLPALVGARTSPLAKLRVETTGTREPISLTELQASLHCHDGDLVSVGVCYSGASQSFAAARPLGTSQPVDEFTGFSGSQVLAEGDNDFWITGEVSQDADIDRTISTVISQVTFSNGETLTPAAAAATQRMGVAVRSAGDDGVHTFRIPGLATTNQGTLIGVYDIRHRSGGDLPGDIDVGMSRSTDGGRTWEPMQTIMDMGDDPKWNYDGVGDPAVLVDRNTGTVWVAATWSHGDRAWRGSGPGVTPDETGQLLLVRSDDDGVTWSAPINITEQVKRPEWCFLLQGPGKGITMYDGTIVFAAQYQDPADQQRLPHSTILYSQDHGSTWSVGTGAFDDTTEAQVVEAAPGVLMLNCRYNRAPTRVVMLTDDLGQTWQPHATSEQALIEPGACMASLIDASREAGTEAGGWLLFSNPDSTLGRHHITIKASPDRGLTWPQELRLLLDEEHSAGYSCLSMIDEATVGILYEGSQAHMTFQRIPLGVLQHSAVSGDRVERSNNR